MDWSRHALLAIDIQYDFLEGIEEADAFETNVRRVFAFCRSQRIPIVHVRSGFQEDGSDWMVFAKLSGRSPCLRGDHGSLVPEWASATPNETVLEKTKLDAFLQTDLHAILERRGVRHVFVCGLVTSVCINITALSAVQRGFVTTVLSDCVADESDNLSEVLPYYGSFVYRTMVSTEMVARYAQIEADIRRIDG